MPQPPKPLSRERLAHVLGMLGSDHDGEALAAARQAHRMVTEAGITWLAALGGQVAGGVAAPPPDAPIQFGRNQLTPPHGERWLDTVFWLLRHGDRLPLVERQWVQILPARWQRRGISAPEAAKLIDIYRAATTAPVATGFV